MDSRTAYLILNLLPGIGPTRVRQLVHLLGTPEAVLAAPVEVLAGVPGIGGKLAGILADWHRHCDPEAEAALVQRAGVELVTPVDPAYPALLSRIHDPPLCLYVRGPVEVLARLRHGLAIVGSRRTTRYGVTMAETLATAAAYAGWPVISGLARGIDTVAHEAALAAGGCTAAVIGSGLGYVYPQENIGLARRIVAAGGVILSEFPMMFRPDRRTFPMRNRVISGLCRGTLVVEAGTRSGSLITAAQALEQNRLVFAVPGRVDSPQSRGCHALIKDGAKLVERFQDIAEEFATLPGLQSLPAGLIPPADSGCREEESADELLQLPGLERKLLSFIDNTDVAIDDLAQAVGEPVHAVLSALLMLEMRHLVRQLPGRRVVRVGPGDADNGF